jgi:hypothetical protein
LTAPSLRKSEAPSPSFPTFSPSSSPSSHPSDAPSHAPTKLCIPLPFLPVVDFDTIVTIELQVVCEDFLTLDEEQKTAIVEAFVSTYDILVASYCDPFFRYVTKADVVRVGTSEMVGTCLLIWRLWESVVKLNNRSLIHHCCYPKG